MNFRYWMDWREAVPSDGKWYRVSTYARRIDDDLYTTGWEMTRDVSPEPGFNSRVLAGLSFDRGIRDKRLGFSSWPVAWRIHLRRYEIAISKPRFLWKK